MYKIYIYIYIRYMYICVYIYMYTDRRSILNASLAINCKKEKGRRERKNGERCLDDTTRHPILKIVSFKIPSSFAIFYSFLLSAECLVGDVSSRRHLRRDARRRSTHDSNAKWNRTASKFE